MTKCKFQKKQGKYISLECSGHTGYGEYGSDVLCAAISAITQSCLVGLTKVLRVKPNVKKDDDSGYLKIELPNNLDKDTYDKASMLMAVVYESIKDLKLGYSKYISMEVIEYVY